MNTRLLVLLIVALGVAAAPVHAASASPMVPGSAMGSTTSGAVADPGIRAQTSNGSDDPPAAGDGSENDTAVGAASPGDRIDGDGDGTLDGVAVDANNDTVIDGIDADDDGIADAIVRGDTDTDGDGQPDFFYNPGPKRVGSIEPGSGFVGPGAIVFQGEEDTRMVNFAENTIIGVPDRGAGGVPLDLNQSIPTQQPFGVYADSQDNALVVNLPRVTNLEVLGESGDEVSGGRIQEDEFVLVQASFNFLAASHAEVFPRDSSGVELREGTVNLSEVVDRSPELSRRLSTFRELVPEDRQGATGVIDIGVQDGLATKDTAYLLLDLGELEKEDVYTITARAEDDKPLGDLVDTPNAEQATPIRIVAAADPRIEFGEGERFTQGEFADFRITESTVGTFQVVSFRASALRRDLAGPVEVRRISNAFRRRDDLVARGVLVGNGTGGLEVVRSGTVAGEDVEWVFGVIETDERGFGAGQIDTGKLDDTRVSINLHDQHLAPAEAIEAFRRSPAGEIDDVALVVERAVFTLETPGETYVAGDEVDLEGSSSIGVDDVAIYARDEGDWQFVLTSPVDDEGVFDENHETLSDLSSILSIPGTYRIGVIDLEDADLDGSGEIDAPEERTLDTLDFRGSTSQRAIRVIGPSLAADFETRDGEVAVGDGIDWNGTSVGPDELVVIFVGHRGNVIVERQVVDSDDVFTEEDVRLEGRLAEGRVTALALSPGRDGDIGAGIPLDDFVTRVENRDVEARREAGGQALTRGQILELIAEDSYDEDGSDDLFVRETFQLTEPNLRIETVVPSYRAGERGIGSVAAGDTVIVRGRTNRDPDDNTIIVEPVTGPNASSMPSMVVDTWTNGTWETRATIPRDVQPGTYTLRADDGDANYVAVVDVTAPAAAGPNATETPGIGGGEGGTSSDAQANVERLPAGSGSAIPLVVIATLLAAAASAVGRRD